MKILDDYGDGYRKSQLTFLLEVKQMNPLVFGLYFY